MASIYGKSGFELFRSHSVDPKPNSCYFLQLLQWASGGGFQLLPHDPDFERTQEIAGAVMDEYRDTLATLAK